MADELEEHRENGSPEGPSEDPHDAGGGARVGHLALRRSRNAPAITAMVTGARRAPRMNTDPASTHPLASSGGKELGGWLWAVEHRRSILALG
jgi:hypothetical protein